MPPIPRILSLLLLSGALAAAQSVAPQQASYALGENIVIDFSGGLGNSSDWIGIYTVGVTPDGSPASLRWLYTNGTQSAGGSATSGSVTFANPNLAAGTHAIWFLANDGYGVIAGPTDLVIVDPGTPGPPEWVTTTFRRRHGIVGTAYTGKISAYASDPGGDSLIFSKTGGPAWLTVSSTGILGGTPAGGDIGINTFTVRVSDATESADATMRIEVFAAGTEHVGQLKVISYNFWHGWGQINGGHRKGLESIILSDADLIGSQETVDNVSGGGIYQVQKIAADLGWFYSPTGAGDNGIASRYPITATLTAGVAKGAKVRITASPLREVILYNCHLDYRRYGPYAAQLSGATVASVMTEELSSQRDEQIAGIISAMTGDLANAGTIPVFLTGDFNAPSHLDWTEAAAGDHGGVWGVPWPASTAVHDAGMSDSFRDVNPDPVAKPAYTWSPLYLGDPQDRIDFVYYKGNDLLPTASEHFHTAIEVTLGAWGSATGPAANNTWPSDHGAILSTFHLDAVDADDDALSDAFEIEHFGNLTSQAGPDDADHDGANNFAEQSTGSSPVDPVSRPVFSVVSPTDAAAPVEVDFGLSPLALGPGLVCEKSESLQSWDPVWSYRADPNLQSPLIRTSDAGGGNWSLTLTDSAATPATAPRLFYRLRSGE